MITTLIQAWILRWKTCNLSLVLPPPKHLLSLGNVYSMFSPRLLRTLGHPFSSSSLHMAGAVSFLPALKLFLHKHLPKNGIVPGPQDCFDVFWQVVIVTLPDPQVDESPRRWCIRATPEVPPGPGRKPGFPAKFNMVLINNGGWTTNIQTLDGAQVAQVCVIFTLPRQFGMYSQALAYIEWFTPFREPDPFSGLLQVSRST
ncbi:hypothetical protein BDR07DRAFT_1480320 [Suillus spraguei]|nr:hypothetical protein BDR07DRAFT_1480320 [Suillus spraguei]